MKPAKLFTSLIVGLLLTGAVYAQHQQSADIALGTHGFGAPWMNTPASQGGFMLNGELHQHLGNNDRHSYFKAGVIIGFFRQRDLKNTLTVLPVLSFHWALGKMFIEPSLALGYAGSVMQSRTYTADGNGVFFPRKNQWLSAAMVQSRMRLGTHLNDRMALFTQYSLQIEGPFHLTPVAPWQGLQVGTTFHLK